MVTEEKTATELKRSMVCDSTPLKKVLNHMDCEAALIVDRNRKLLGLITDGDIRRAFLSGHSLETPVSEIMTASPMTISQGLSREKILSIMLKKKIRHLPIVNEEKEVLGLEVLKNQYDETEVPEAVLMAGGKGTRLRPLTFEKPKPLLKVGDDTIIDNVLSGLKAGGINDVVISVNYLGDQIKEHLNDGSDHELNIDYVEERKDMGTAGALSLLDPRPKNSFIVMNADLLTEIDFRALSSYHKEEGNDFSVCVRKITESIQYGVVKLNERRSEISTIDEKPDYSFLVNAGIYMLKPEIIDLIPQNTFYDMVSLINKAIESGYKVGAFPIVEYWRDIGQHKEIQLAECEAKFGKIINAE